MKNFADHKDHWTSDSTFLVFMSHGVSTGICGTKSNGTTDILSFSTIYENFNNKHCKALVGKPKVVIIQCCRGGESLLQGACQVSKPVRLTWSTGWVWGTPSLTAGPAFLDNIGSVMVCDSIDPEMPTFTSDGFRSVQLRSRKIRETHLESDFATLYSSTPGKQFHRESSPV